MTETNKENQHTLSPVANQGPIKSWGVRVMLGVLALGAFYFMLTTHKDKPKETPPPDNAAADVSNIKAPTLGLSDHDIAKLKLAAQTLSIQEEKHESVPPVPDNPLEKMRMVAPTLMYSSDSSASNNPDGNKSSTARLNDQDNHNFTSQLQENLNAAVTSVVSATHIAHPGYTLTQGTLLFATLETRIVSDLPGMVRAIASDDIYAEDGSQILLPKGSKLIGQYASQPAQGQQRIFVLWQRAIRPDGIDIALNSPGTDPLGGAGLSGAKIDYHFFQSFGTAALLSLIGAGSANVGVNSTDPYNSSASYRSALMTSFSQSAQNSLTSSGVIKPTLYVNQGNKISVFVARDLDFYNELHTNSSTLSNISP